MLRRIDRLVLRVPHVAAAARHYRDVLGLKLVREEAKLAVLRFPEQETELVLHSDPDLPAEATYFLVDDVREIFRRRAELKLQFVQPPAPSARGYRAAIRDPFGTIMLLVDRTLDPAGQASAVEDGRPPSMLFPGVKEKKLPVNREALIQFYQEIGRTADDLPYTPDFEKLYVMYCVGYSEQKPTREEVWRHLLNVRKGGLLPKLGEARSKPPAVTPEERAQLKLLVGREIGRRDRLPYTSKFDTIVDAFNRTQGRPLSPHLVWRLVATLAK